MRTLVFITLLLVLACTEAVEEKPPIAAPVVAGIEVLPSEIILSAIGEEVQLFAEVTGKDGRAIAMETLWKSLEGEIASVGSDGIVKSRKAGTARIVASLAGTSIEGLAFVKVEPLPVGLEFTDQPRDVAAGSPISPAVRVSVVDANGHTVEGWRGTIEVESAVPGEALLGTTLMASEDGSAAFMDLSLLRAGEGKRIQARTPEGLESESEPFSVVPGAPMVLVPSNLSLQIGLGDPFDISLAVEDAFGNPVLASGLVVQALVDPAMATLIGKASVQTKEGIARFSGLKLNLQSMDWFAKGCYEGKVASIEYSLKGGLPAAVEVNQGLLVRGFTRSMNFDGGCILMTSGDPYCRLWRWGTENKEWFRARTDDIYAEIVSFVGNTSEVCALDADGSLWCWRGGIRNAETVLPMKMAFPDETHIKWVGAEFDHLCALSASGEAYCWGSSLQGQLGIGVRESRAEPTLVPGLKFSKLSVSNQRTCGITEEGIATCWGAGGALGNGSTDDQLSPVEVTFPVHEISREIASGGDRTCVITTSEKVYCWGDLALEVPGTAGLSLDEIHLGGSTNCLRSGGDTYCWNNSVGFGFIGPSEGPTTKVVVPGNEKIKKIGVLAASENHYGNGMITESGRFFGLREFPYSPGGLCPPLALVKP